MRVCVCVSVSCVYTRAAPGWEEQGETLRIPRSVQPAPQGTTHPCHPQFSPRAAGLAPSECRAGRERGGPDSAVVFSLLGPGVS